MPSNENVTGRPEHSVIVCFYLFDYLFVFSETVFLKRCKREPKGVLCSFLSVMFGDFWVWTHIEAIQYFTNIMLTFSSNAV